jgi:hypothetical protein
VGMELIGRRLSAAELRALFDDPSIADGLLEHLGTLRDFYRSAAEQGWAILLAMV